jgi:hypothetical protein
VGYFQPPLPRLKTRPLARRNDESRNKTETLQSTQNGQDCEFFIRPE